MRTLHKTLLLTGFTALFCSCSNDHVLSEKKKELREREEKLATQEKLYLEKEARLAAEHDRKLNSLQNEKLKAYRLQEDLKTQKKKLSEQQAQVDKNIHSTAIQYLKLKEEQAAVNKLQEKLKLKNNVAEEAAEDAKAKLRAYTRLHAAADTKMQNAIKLKSESVVLESKYGALLDRHNTLLKKHNDISKKYGTLTLSNNQLVDRYRDLRADNIALRRLNNTLIANQQRIIHIHTPPAPTPRQVPCNETIRHHVIPSTELRQTQTVDIVRKSTR